MAESSCPSSSAAAPSITITLPDGSTRTYGQGVTGLEIAESIAKSLAKAAIAVKVDGQQRDLCDPIMTDAAFEIITLDSDEGLEIMRHTVAAQILACAVKNLYPEAKLAIGPTIENGFYYDVEFKEPLSEDDLDKIEKEMRKIKESNAPIQKSLNSKDQAVKAFEKRSEPYKVKIIEESGQEDNFQLYAQGETGFIDLCRGPHLPSLKHVGAFKLMKVAGAYWRGDQNNQMLTRIYGTAWRNDKELKEYLQMLEEAEKRDHRKLGAQMDLFHFQEEAQGSVFWHAKGFVIYNQLENYIRRRLRDVDYQEVKTPQLIDNKLWEKSGHWGKFRENMFVVPDEVPNTDEDGPVITGKGRLMAIKPMNCPAHVQIFNQGIKSYRDLPIRMAEFGCCHRNEAHGALHGLMRVRQMTQDDAHIFCREDQILDEVKAFVELFYAVYQDFGFTDIQIKLATRPEVRAGDDAVWDRAEAAMAQGLEALGLDFEVTPGEGAFYGPKYEFHLRDAIGRTWQCGTCQLDFVLPERLGASYIGEDGDKHIPVMIHRAVFGSLERFAGILIESTGGKLPLWIAPVQAVVATITGDADGYAQEIYDRLFALGLRVELDTRNEKINYKVREHSVAKVPVIFVVGNREADEKTVAVRRLGGKDQEMMSLDAAIESLVTECKPPY
ncbi:MAG: threonine--tRNA ligase [Rhodospirillales bacterium]|nr:threonine--tRNA ligase [Rhodospirillales bacterium]MCB9997102.1 threonine--tRNA ligase [Rhodospirillales bacterium]